SELAPPPPCPYSEAALFIYSRDAGMPFRSALAPHTIRATARAQDTGAEVAGSNDGVALACIGNLKSVFCTADVSRRGFIKIDVAHDIPLFFRNIEVDKRVPSAGLPPPTRLPPISAAVNVASA